MVSFKVITSALALASGIAAQATPAQLLVDIKTLTLMTQALQPEADKISLLNGPLIIIGQGPFPNLIRGFTDIVTTGTTSLATQRGSAPIPAGADAEAISEAWTRFAAVQTKLLNTMTGKAALFNTVPLIGAPIAAVLRQDSRIIDSFGFALIDRVSPKAADIQTQSENLAGTLETAIKAYDGLVNPGFGKRSLRFARRAIEVAA